MWKQLPPSARLAAANRDMAFMPLITCGVHGNCGRGPCEWLWGPPGGLRNALPRGGGGNGSGCSGQLRDDLCYFSCADVGPNICIYGLQDGPRGAGRVLRLLAAVSANTYVWRHPWHSQTRYRTTAVFTPDCCSCISIHWDVDIALPPLHIF